MVRKHDEAVNQVKYATGCISDEGTDRFIFIFSATYVCVQSAMAAFQVIFKYN